MSALGMELRKIKRRRFWLMAASAAGLELAWVMAATGKRAGSAAEQRLLGLSLNESMSMCALVMPLIAALLASRLATVDTEERMGRLLTALGQRAIARFDAKLVLGSFVVALGQASLLAFVALAGPGMGLRATAAYQDSLWPTLVVMLAASIAATAVQLALATCVDKQGVGLAAGALAGVLCSGLPSAHLEALGWLFPWGVTVAGNPFSSLASFRAHAPVTVAHPWAGALFAVIAAAVWVVAARLAVVHKENHR